MNNLKYSSVSKNSSPASREGENRAGRGNTMREGHFLPGREENLPGRGKLKREIVLFKGGMIFIVK